jgi:ABC-2 type transport system ATP-binding protein
MSPPALDVRALRAGHAGRAVLDGVDLALAPGEWYVLLGPNGVGKSTLLDCVGGRLAPWAGTVSIAGARLDADPIAAKRALGFGCAPEQLPDLLTPRQCLEVHAAAKSLAAVGDDVLALADALAFTPYLDAWVDTLSLGTRQKLAVLLALVGAPRLVVLDEAFNGLDPRSALRLKAELRVRTKAGAAVLLATHSLDIVEHHADRAGLLAGGRIVREWTRTEIDALAARGGDALELAIADALPDAP